jgi:hypothetical protein
MSLVIVFAPSIVLELSDRSHAGARLPRAESFKTAWHRDKRVRGARSASHRWSGAAI